MNWKSGPPDISAFSITDLILIPNIIRNMNDPFKSATKFFTSFSAGHIIRITGNNKRSFTIRLKELRNQFTCSERITVSTPRWINMISDMSEIIYILTFSVSITDLSDLLPFSVFSDFPNSLIPKTQNGIRIACP